MKTGTICLLILFTSIAHGMPMAQSSSEPEEGQEARIEREIKGSDELTESPETDVDRRKRETEDGDGEHKEHEVAAGQEEAHAQIDVRDKRRIKQPSEPTTTTTTTTLATTSAAAEEEKRSAQHEEQNKHEKRSPGEHTSEEHHLGKRADGSKEREEEEITSKSTGECEEKSGDSENLPEPGVEEAQGLEEPSIHEEPLLAMQPAVRVKKATHGKHLSPRVMSKNQSNRNVGENTGSPNDSPQK